MEQHNSKNITITVTMISDSNLLYFSHKIHGLFIVDNFESACKAHTIATIINSSDADAWLKIAHDYYRIIHI